MLHQVTKQGVFRVRQFNGVVEIYTRQTPVAMVTKIRECLYVKARLVLSKLLDNEDDVDVEFNLIKDAVQQERVCLSVCLLCSEYCTIYTSLFISNTDSKKKKKTITNRTRKTSNHLQAKRSETIVDKTAP